MEDGGYTSKDRSVTEIINPAYEPDEHEVPYEKLDGPDPADVTTNGNNNHVVFKEPLHRSPSFPHKVKFYYYHRCSPRRMLPVLIILGLVLAGLAVAIYFVVKSEEDSKTVPVQEYDSTAAALYMRILNMPYIPAYDNSESAEFTDLEQNITQELNGIFVNTELERELYGTVITQIRKGSIRLDCVFVFSSDPRHRADLERLVDEAFTRNTRTTNSFDKYLGPFLIESKTMVIEGIPLGEEPTILDPITYPPITQATTLPAQSSPTTSPSSTTTKPGQVTTVHDVTTASDDVITTPRDVRTTSKDVVTTSGDVTTVMEVVTTVLPKPTCENIQFSECQDTDDVPYGRTTFPNLLGDASQSEMSTGFGIFLSVLESNCYTHARRFLCSLTVPQCTEAEEGLVVTPPCQNMCEDFFRQCAAQIANIEVLQRINCRDFPTEISPTESSSELAEPPVCISAPVVEMIAVRLVPGLGDFEGRVEVRHEGVWGTVCDFSWSDLDAQVVCRQLGYSGRAVAKSGGSFGEAESEVPIWLSNMNCMGTEEHLALCQHSDWEDNLCQHDNDAGVTCDIDNMDVSLLPVRLYKSQTEVDGLDGVVQVQYENKWGGICDDFFGVEEATVVCTMLGHNVTGVVQPRDQTIRTTTRIWLDNVDCMGTEPTLALCEHNGWGKHNCDIRETVTVSCAGTDDVTTSPTQLPSTASPMLAVRLVDGPNERSGRVEVFYDGQWGTICNDLFPVESARVLCNMMGFSGEAKYEFSRYGAGTGVVWLNHVMCQGSERSIQDCNHDDWGDNDCDHMNDVSISCSDQVVTPVVTTEATTTAHPDTIDIRLAGGSRPSEGRVELYINNQWGTICDDSFDKTDAAVLCNMLGYNGSAIYLGNTYGQGQGPIWLANIDCEGTEDSIMDCQHDGLEQHACRHNEDVSIACQYIQEIDVRLVDGPSSSAGRVEILFNATWGTICDDSFDDRDALVLCRMMGFNGSASFLNNDYGEGTGPIWLEELECTGTEQTLLECDHDGFGQHHCTHGEDVSMTCSYEPEIHVRLVDGRDEHEGRLEVYHDKQWGSVCYDDFDNVDAQVVCNMLKLPGPGRLVVLTDFISNAPIWLSNVNCVGNESSLLDCPHSDWQQNICSHYEDVYISCRPYEPIRLVDGSHPQEGRVEILHNGQWGTVCDDDFDELDAEVICRYLGYDPTNAEYLEQRFGSGVGVIWLESSRCAGSEQHIADCRHQDWGEHNCVHDEDVSISCGDTCADITIDYCQLLPYSQTLLPNSMDHFTQEEARSAIQAKNWQHLAPICGVDFEHFFCSAHVPKCLVENATAVVHQPCRSLCQRARSACEPFMLNAEVQWPFEWQCDNFPDETLDETLCFDPVLGVTDQPPLNATHTGK